VDLGQKTGAVLPGRPFTFGPNAASAKENASPLWGWRIGLNWRRRSIIVT
jgi:hypothetical protein